MRAALATALLIGLSGSAIADDLNLVGADPILTPDQARGVPAEQMRDPNVSLPARLQGAQERAAGYAKSYADVLEASRRDAMTWRLGALIPTPLRHAPGQAGDAMYRAATERQAGWSPTDDLPLAQPVPPRH